MKRLFFALWPDDTVRQSCDKIIKSVQRPGEIAVHPENLHITLQFLGNIDEKTEGEIIESASSICIPHLTLTFDSLNFWVKPRILCLTGPNCYPDLNAMVTELTEISFKHGIPVDSRPYKPHITLIRKAKVERLIKYEPIIWQSCGFCLVESCSSPEGVMYRVIQRWENNS